MSRRVPIPVAGSACRLHSGYRKKATHGRFEGCEGLSGQRGSLATVAGASCNR